MREDKERLTIVTPCSIGRQAAVQNTVYASRCGFPRAIKGASYQPSIVPITTGIRPVDKKAAAFPTMQVAMALN